MVTLQATFTFACDSCGKKKKNSIRTSRLLAKVVYKLPIEIAEDLLPEGWEIREGPAYLCEKCKRALFVTTMKWGDK